MAPSVMVGTISAVTTLGADTLMNTFRSFSENLRSLRPPLVGLVQFQCEFVVTQDSFSSFCVLNCLERKEIKLKQLSHFCK